MSPCMSHGSQCLQTNFHDTNFQNVCSVKQTFQLTNFHNINFQKVEWSGELPICKFQSTNFQLADFQHMTVNVSKHVTWQSMSSCIPHGVKCLHTYHMAVNVSISHSGKYLHAYHMVVNVPYISQTVNVSMHVTWCQMQTCQKDKTSGSAQAKVHQQYLTNFKKT